jgi:hypothetical protein
MLCFLLLGGPLDKIYINVNTLKGGTMQAGPRLRAREFSVSSKVTFVPSYSPAESEQRPRAACGRKRNLSSSSTYINAFDDEEASSPLLLSC